MLRYPTLIVLLLTYSEYGFSQRVQFGAIYMTGNSRGIENSNSSLSGSVNDYLNGFVEPGLYAFINYRKDTATDSPLKYVKIDFGLANRTGTFDLGNSNLAKITTASFDLSLLLPISFPVAREIEGYAAFGGVLSFQYAREVTSQLPASLGMKTVNPGFATELGFKLKSGSAIGYRVMVQSIDYPCRVGALFLAFSPRKTKRRK